ncbi:metallophosphoesterase family protein, partial [Acidobacteriota bacterium]
GLNCPVKSVFGNCDGEREGLVFALEGFGVVRIEPFSFEEKGIRFIVKHLERGITEICRREEPDVLVFGHTHKPEVDRQGQTLIINPGETGGWINGRPTVALLDTDSLAAKIIPI